MSAESMSWASRIFGGAELGDLRRTRRLVRYAAAQAEVSDGSTLAACRGDNAAAEGAYRLLRNDSVKAEAIAASGFASTAAQARESSVVLAVEDTTVLSVPKRLEMELGDLGGPVNSVKQGMFVHSVLLLDGGSGRTLGLAYQKRWTRDAAERGKRHQRRERAYEEKESAKWQHATEGVRALLGETMRNVVSVCDREADVYEYLLHKQAHQERFVVRMSWDRKVKNTDESLAYLATAARAARTLGKTEVSVAQRGGANGRQARKALLTVRAGTVKLLPPKRLERKGELIAVNVVEAVEEHAPAGIVPLHWILLTTEPVSDFASARQILNWYGLRWRIEDFHRAWKTGCGVEDRRQHAADNYERVAVVLAFVAIRLVQLRELGLETPNASCESVLTKIQWRTLWLGVERKKPLPKKPPTIEWAMRAIAKLGGWIDTQRTGRPGWENLGRGWRTLEERVEGVEAAMRILAAGEM